MSETYKCLAQGQVAASVGAILTVPSAKTWIVVEITFLNTDSSTRTLDVYIKGTAAANQVKKGVSLAAGESLEFTGRMALEAGDIIYATCDSASKITYTAFGAEIA